MRTAPPLQILVPVMYSLVDDFTEFFRRHYQSLGDPEDDRDEPVEEASPSDPVEGRPYRPGPLVEEPEPVGVRREKLDAGSFGRGIVARPPKIDDHVQDVLASTCPPLLIGLAGVVYDEHRYPLPAQRQKPRLHRQPALGFILDTRSNQRR